MSLFLMSLLGGGGRGSKQIKLMSLYILFFFGWLPLVTISFSPKKGQKTTFLDPILGHADNKNAIETHFFATLRPQKSMGGILIGL